MKKLLFITIVLVASALSLSAQVVKGDMNDDGQLTVADLADLASRILTNAPLEYITVDSTTNGNIHEYVDLGLSVKWATCNVGAEKPEDYGDCFAWGETTGYNSGKTYFDWSTYKLCNGSYNTLTKYCTSSSLGMVDNKTVLDPEDDAAHVNWGGSWRMPTKEEQDELRDNCTWTWVTQNGVKGRKVTGPNGNSIFLPAAGCRYDVSLANAGSDGFYWSSSLNASYSKYAYYLNFNSSSVRWYDCGRYGGHSVRAVCP